MFWLLNDMHLVAPVPSFVEREGCYIVIHKMSSESTTAGVREELLRQFIETGERERLQEILRSKLQSSGWQDRIKDKCQKVVNESKGNIENLTVDEVAEEVTPFARNSVPEEIKAEMLEEIRSFIYRSLPETTD